MDTIDTQLDAAKARVDTLEQELASANARAGELAAANATLEAANTELRENLQAVHEKLAGLDASHREALGTIETLKVEMKTAEEKAAEIYGAKAADPVAVTPQGNPERPLIERFRAIKDPAEQTRFLRALSEEERMQLYSHA